jgi:hypothetical protein
MEAMVANLSEDERSGRKDRDAQAATRIKEEMQELKVRLRALEASEDTREADRIKEEMQKLEVRLRRLEAPAVE